MYSHTGKFDLIFHDEHICAEYQHACERHAMIKYTSKLWLPIGGYQCLPDHLVWVMAEVAMPWRILVEMVGGRTHPVVVSPLLLYYAWRKPDIL